MTGVPMSRTTAPDTPVATVSVRLLETIEPTATDRTRYHAGDVWAMPIDRAEALIDAGAAERVAAAPAPARRPSPADEE